MKLEITNQNPGQNGSLKVNVVFDKSDLKQEETPYGMLYDLNGCNIEGDIGAPALPSKIIQVALPPFTYPKEVSANIVSKMTISKAPILVAPIQEPRAGVNEKAPRVKGTGGQASNPKHE